MASQYPLSLPWQEVFSDGNFIVSACNETALHWLRAWPEWPGRALLLFGPAGSGKTHLARIWAARAKAVELAPGQPGPPPGEAPVLIENIERLEGEEALFHLLNRCKEEGRFLLMTSAVAAAALPFRLPDLRSRLLALTAAEILPPDDTALAGALRKQFSDRQLKIDDAVIDFLLARMTRSFAQAKTLVEALDRRAMAEKKPITVAMAKAVLAKLA